MTDAARRPDQDDHHADRMTFFWVAGFFTAYLLVDILSQATEIARFDLDLDPRRYATYEITSIISILALFPLLRRAVTLATPGEQSWQKTLAVHALGCLAFSVIHIAVMVALRKAVFAVAFHGPYIFTDNLPREFTYEFRKDIVTYALIAFFLTFGRQLTQQRRELAATREDARKSKRLTLKCGGRAIFVDASEIVSVKSASNYVEVDAAGQTYLARATLASIERQLADAGVNALRVHRSWIVNADRIRKIDPTGEGDVTIEMTSGAVIPGSRRYRDKLPGA